jgi:translation initiation factor 2B subunit (eIF-2B alpha/beta/delta family)
LHSVEENEIVPGPESIGRDRDAGASQLLARLLPILADAVTKGEAATMNVARVICEGQPAMASLWNACAAAVMQHSAPGRFTRVRAEMERAPAALIRAASVAMLDALQGTVSPHIVTISYSGSVAGVLAAVAGRQSFALTCGEGRPRFEGRRMAQALAAHVPTTLTTDAALTSVLQPSTIVVVGADAISAHHWSNKVGTRGLVAAAAAGGIPVYVAATRDKVQSQMLAERWTSSTGPAVEIWDQAPPGVSLYNPYFERIPVEFATLFLTDAGPISPADLPGICERYAPDIANLIHRLR